MSHKHERDTNSNTQREHSLPCSIQAERGVLGSLLIDPEALCLISEQLAADDFYREAHRLIYVMILRLSASRTPADYVTLCDALEQAGHLEHVGGASYLAGLINSVPTSGNLEAYAAIVARKALLRRLIALGTQMVASAYSDEDQEAETLLEQAEQQLFQLGQRYTGTGKANQTLDDLLVDYFAWLGQDEGRQIQVPTGLPGLDRLLGGWYPGDLVVLAGRPGEGKTSLALSLAHHAARYAQVGVGIFSLEMSQREVQHLSLAMEGRGTLPQERFPRVKEEQWPDLVEVMAHLSGAGIWIDETASLTTTHLRRTARRWKAQHGIGPLIIDYLQLVQAVTPDGRRLSNREQEVAHISRSLKALARELEIPVLALSQLSRAVESRASKVPQLSDLRESGSIEADSDVVLFLQREGAAEAEESNTEQQAHLLVAKHRHGATGSVALRFDPQQIRFGETADPPREARQRGKHKGTLTLL